MLHALRAGAVGLAIVPQFRGSLVNDLAGILAAVGPEIDPVDIVVRDPHRVVVAVAEGVARVAHAGQ